MSKNRKQFKAIRALLEGGADLHRLYDIVFSFGDGISFETATMARKLTRTREEARRSTEALAGALGARFGNGDRYIGLCGENGMEWITLFWAILRSGNRPLLIPPRIEDADLERLCKKLHAVGVVSCGAERGGAFPSVTFASLSRESAASAPRGSFGETVAVVTEDRSDVLLFEGTQLCDGLLRLCACDCTALESGEGLKFLVALPLYHTAGLCAYLLGAALGATFVFPLTPDADLILRAARNQKVTHLFAPPYVWQAAHRFLGQLLDSKEKKLREKFNLALEKHTGAKQFREFRAHLLGESAVCCVCVGGALPPLTASALLAVGYPILPAFATLEAGFLTLERSAKPVDHPRGTVGHPLLDGEWKIDPATGHLLVSDRIRARRWGEEPQTDRWQDTGYGATQEEDGRLCLHGRTADAITVNGSLRYPDEAETFFHLPGATAFSVIADPTESGFALIVQIPPDMIALQKNHLLRAIESANCALPAEKRVWTVKFTNDSLWDGSSLSVCRRELRRRIAAGEVRLFDLTEEEGKTGEESEIKKILRQMFADNLGVGPEEIADNAHFMIDLGGSSVEYFTLVGEINERFNISLGFEANQFGYTLNDFERMVKELLK